MDTSRESEFKKQFWEWFDTLPSAQKRPFHTYPVDTAEVYFYNKIYRHTES